MAMLSPNIVKLFSRSGPKDEPMFYRQEYLADFLSPKTVYSWCGLCEGLIEEGVGHNCHDMRMQTKRFLPLSEHTGIRYDPELVSVIHR